MTLKPSDFVHVADGREFTGFFPPEVQALHGIPLEGEKEGVAIVMDVAKEGDPDYEKVLLGWMLGRGYILKDRAES
jgi:hypothetical protein